MAYKTFTQEAPPSTVKSPKPAGAQKEVTPTEAASQDKLGKEQEQEFGYIVTNQR